MKIPTDSRDLGRLGPLLLVRTPELRALAAPRLRVEVAFRQLTPGTLERLAPRAVGFALFAEDCDAFQVLGRLERLGYRGRVLALAPPLPARRMVERELQAEARGLRLRVLCLAALAP